MKTMFITLLFMLSINRIYPGLFSSYDKKTPEEVIRDLAIEQIDNPNDPYVNYNLGVALYQTRKYEAAKNNFERAVSNAKNKKLKERSYFNLANSCYKNALSALPVNWENESTKIEQDKLAAAIDNAKASVKNYENLLASNKDNGPAKVNLKKTKEFLEKLMKKQPQQKQNQQQDQKQGDGTEQGNQQDQQKQDVSKDQKQDQDKSGVQKQDGQQDKSQKESSEQEQKQDQTQPGEQKESQQSKEADQQSRAQQAQEQRDSQQQAFDQAAQKESAEEKSMRLMLENLQGDEDSLQKVIIQRQTKDQKPLQSGQKPW
ncbi:MAG: hypothetical protein WCS92_01260 [Candidatus Babeliales bacterium]|jgi:Ca-activated chloride channel family protein|nr:MAG: BatB [candidate division TM6 bacterium GW2011_GWF2_36_6]